MAEDTEFLSQDEVDSLLSGIAADGVAGAALPLPAGDIRPFDPTSRDHLAGLRLPVLESINEKFSRALRIALAEFTRIPCDLTLSPVRIMKFAELVHGVPAITGISLFNLAPLAGTGALFINHDTTALIIDSLFGGGGRACRDASSREFTPIEIRMVEKISQLVMECYRKSWAAIHVIEFGHEKTETQKQFVSLGGADAPMVLTAINLKVGQAGGELLLCLPFASLEPVLPLLTRASEEESASADRNWLRLLSAQVQSAEVELNANLGTASIPLRQIMEMKPGDFIPINVPSRVSAMVDGIPLMECNFGISNGQYSLRVERVIPRTE
jgi:flagellar motor switch protein FliM